MESQVKFYFAIISVMIAFGMIAGGFILAVVRYQKRLYNKQQELLRLDAQYKKELLQSSIESAEAERMQIAKDVHDEIGSIFSTLSLSINQLADATVQNKHLSTSKNLIQSGIDSVRRISRSIVPFELELLGLEQTIENYFDTLGAVSDIEIEFESTAPLEKLTPAAALALYRIVQELTSNCIKYAKASAIRLAISTTENRIVLTYNDNGVGTVLGQNRRGIGLKNIESRTIVLNGEVNFKSAPGEGFTCTVSIPLHNNMTV